MSLPVKPGVRLANGVKSLMAEASLCFFATTSKICRRETSSGIRMGILMSVRPDRRMAESMRSTRFVLSMRSTLPRSELSAQKLNAAPRTRAHAEHPALLGEALGEVGLARARGAHEDHAQRRRRVEAALHDVGHLAELGHRVIEAADRGEVVLRREDLQHVPVFLLQQVDLAREDGAPGQRRAGAPRAL